MSLEGKLQELQKRKDRIIAGDWKAIKEDDSSKKDI